MCHLPSKQNPAGSIPVSRSTSVHGSPSAGTEVPPAGTEALKALKGGSFSLLTAEKENGLTTGIPYQVMELPSQVMDYRPAAGDLTFTGV